MASLYVPFAGRRRRPSPPRIRLPLSSRARIYLLQSSPRWSAPSGPVDERCHAVRRLLCFLRPLERGGRAVVHMGPLHRLQAQRHASSIFPAGPRGPWVSSLPERLFQLGQPDPARYVFFPVQ